MFLEFAWLEPQDLQDSVPHLALWLACGCPYRTLSVPPELFALHQVCDKIISSSDDAPKTFKDDSKAAMKHVSEVHITSR
jgi:hypothetical protein